MNTQKNYELDPFIEPKVNLGNIKLKHVKRRRID